MKNARIVKTTCKDCGGLAVCAYNAANAVCTECRKARQRARRYEWKEESVNARWPKDFSCHAIQSTPRGPLSPRPEVRA